MPPRIPDTMQKLTPEQRAWAESIQANAIEKGAIELDENGRPIVQQLATVKAELEEVRQQHREESGPSQTADQERLVLGFCLVGKYDHREQWGEFRGLLGLQFSDELPEVLWTDKAARWVAAELDATYRNRRAVQLMNGDALIESMREAIESRTSSASLGDFAQAVRSIEAECENTPASDFRLSAEILRTKWGRRKMTRLGEALVRGSKREADPIEIIEKATNELNQTRDIFSGRIGGSFAFNSIEDAWFQVEQEVNKEHAEPLPTGILSVDMDIQGGVKPNDAGKLHLIGARTGVGKSTLAIAAAGGLVQSGAHCLFLSCELNQKEIGARFLSNYARHLKGAGRLAPEVCEMLPQWRLEGRGKKKPEGFDLAYLQLMECIQEDKQAGSVGDFSSFCKFLCEAEQFVEVMRAAKQRDPAITAIFLDHFHALRPTSNGPRDRSAEMEVRAQIFHGAAKELEVDLFCLCQLNRQAADDPKGPAATHINGTDALAQLASAVWLLEYKKPDLDLGESFDRGVLTLVHGKVRNGQRIGDQRVTCNDSVIHLERDHCFVDADRPEYI